MSSVICDRSLASPAQFNLVITISFALVPIFSFALSIIEKTSNFQLTLLPNLHAALPSVV